MEKKHRSPKALASYQQARREREVYDLTHNVFGVPNVLGDLLPALQTDLQRLYARLAEEQERKA